jgi:biopolymer transport protein ExbD
MNLGRRNRVKAEGGMSSMTDLVFLLLIFFIIMSTMAEPGIPVDLPDGQKNERTKENSTLNVGINANNMYLLAEDTETEYTFAEIEPLIIAKMEANIEKNIKISGDKSADYEFVFQLIALAKQKKWKPILVFK